MSPKSAISILKTALFVVLGALPFKDVSAKSLDIQVLQETRTWYSSSQSQELRAALSVDFHFAQLVSMLPEQYALRSTRNDAKLQSLIDQAFLKISKTPSMKSVCRNILNSKADLITAFYGVSQSVGAQIASQCEKGAGLVEDIPRKRIYPRYYTFVFSPDTNMKLDSWTSVLGGIYVFVNPDQIDEQRLLRILVHELAISLDVKEQLGVMRSGKAKGNSPELPLFQDQQQECQLVSALRTPEIKYSFSAVRAFKFENAVMKELGFKDLSDTNLSCQDEFNLLRPTMKSLSGALAAEDLFNANMLKARCAVEDSSNLDKKLNLLMATNMIFEDGRKMSACNYLSTPQLSLWTFSGTSGGPRPRIGNGWGALTQPKPKIEIRDKKFLNNDSRIKKELNVKKK